MSLEQTTLTAFTQTDRSREEGLTGVQWVFQHLVYVSLGVVGGGSGVALVIGATVLIQILFYSTAFLPNVTLLTIAAVLIGLGASWLLSHVAQRLLPSFRYNLRTHGLQIILISSALTSLLENFLFLHNITALSIPTNTVWVSVAPLLHIVG
jgi:hypothetical protein